MSTLTDTNQLFRAFADETRMRILHILTVDELCVCQIIEILSLPQSKASRHLSYLKRAGLVKSRKEGLWMYYSLSTPKGKLQKDIMGCVKSCFKEVPVMQKDLVKARSAIKKSACS